MARPTKFSQALADKICIAIMQGKPLRRVARQCGITTETIFSWIQTRPGFSDQYDVAKRVQAEIMADDIRSISDERPKVVTEMTIGEITKKETKLDSAGINRNRLRVDARKWIAAKLLPKKYGEHLKVEASGPNGQPLPGVNVNLSGLSDEQLEQLAQITTLLSGDTSRAATAT